MYAGTDISTYPLPQASEFLKKGILGKYILVCTCPNGKLISKTVYTCLHRKWHKYQELCKECHTIKKKMDLNH